MKKKILLVLLACAMIGVALLVRPGWLHSLRSSSIYNEATGLWEYTDDIGTTNDNQNTAPTVYPEAVCMAEKAARNQAQADLDTAKKEFATLSLQKPTLESRKKILETTDKKDSNYTSSIAYLNDAILTQQWKITAANDAFYKVTKFKTYTDFEAEVTKQQGLQKTLPSDLQKLRNDLSFLGSQLQTLKDELALLNKTNPKTTDIKNQITAKNTAITNKNKDITAKNTAITAKNKEIKTNADALTTLAKQKSADAGKTPLTIKSAENAIADITKKRDVLASELVQITSSLDKIATSDATITSLTQKLTDAQALLDACYKTAAANNPTDGTGGPSSPDKDWNDGKDQGPNKYPACYADNGSLNCSGWVAWICCKKVDACKATPFCRYGSDVPMECFDADILEELRRAREELAGLQHLKDDINKQLEAWTIEPAHAASELDWINKTIDLDAKIIKQILDRRAELQCPNY